MSEKSSFDIAKKRFTTKASLQSLDIVRAEAVKERPAVWTCHSKLRSVRNVEDRSGFRSGSIFRLGVSEVGLRMSWLHAVVSESIIKGCSCGQGRGRYCTTRAESNRQERGRLQFRKQPVDDFPKVVAANVDLVSFHGKAMSRFTKVAHFDKVARAEPAASQEDNF